MLTNLLILSIPVSAAALLYARREYRKRGRLTALGLLLLCLMLLVPNLVLEYATRYELPSTALDYLGVVVGVAGLALCLIGIFNFDSLAKVLCLEPRSLTRSGFYRWSRNPQYLGWFLFLLGFALNDWSLWCLAALGVVAITLHLLILIEEEHLRRVFGQPYVDYCARVPRYAGWGRGRV
jgi:protein-S-isoprenylcysteine O-methyltransferase Ste14